VAVEVDVMIMVKYPEQVVLVVAAMDKIVVILQATVELI
jgi:hypothetical protein